jgi:hypothetical protein
MATRKFLFLEVDGVSTYPEEAAPTDDIELAFILLTGQGGVAADANGTRIINVGTPEDGADAVNKDYVDSTNPAVESLIGLVDVAIGDPVCWSATPDRFTKGDASADALARVFGVAVEAITAGNAGRIQRIGTVAGALSGATPGAPYYLAVGGGVGAAIPGTGNRIVVCGYAKNATDLEIAFHDYGKKF